MKRAPNVLAKIARNFLKLFCDEYFIALWFNKLDENKKNTLEKMEQNSFLQYNKREKKKNMKLLENLMLEFTERNGIIEILKDESYLKYDGENLLIPLTLRRAELIAFLNSKIDIAIKAELYLEAHNFELVKQFYSNDYVRVFDTNYGIGLMTPTFLKDYIMVVLALLSKFEKTEIIDTANKVLLNYNELELSNFLPILHLIKEDEILWGWNRHHFKKIDFVAALQEGCIFKQESTEMINGIEHLNYLLKRNELNNSKLFIVIEGMAYHEEEIKMFIEELVNWQPNCSFKIAIKEAAELEPRLHIIFTN
jgi:hypothetical protein